MEKIKSTPLYVKVKKGILKMIKEDKFEDNKLPSESKLAELLGVGRSTVREALMALNREGIITKKHGIGNIVHFSTLQTQMRIDQIRDFNKLLRDAGYQVSIDRSEYRWIDDIEDYNLKISGREEKKYLMTDLVYKADGDPAIWALIFVPGSVLKSDIRKNKMYFDTLSNFLNTYTEEDTSHSISKFKPGLAGKKVSNLFAMNSSEPIIEWEEHFYGIFDTLLCFTRIIFNPELVNLTILRKWA